MMTSNIIIIVNNQKPATLFPRFFELKDLRKSF